ncbi:unnamed protein product [Cunninghamella echinulata]
MNSWQTMNNMIQTEGLGSMFKGVLAPVMGLAGLNAILFVSYGGILRYLQPTIDNTTTLPSLAQVYIAGCGAGMACFLFSTPTELIKIKAQMSHTNKSSWQVTKEVFYRNGIKGFYQGGWITLIRDAPSYGIYFWVYEGMKRYLNSDPTQQGEAAAWKYLLAGGLAGTVSWTSIYPIDVIKSRLQMQLIPSSQHQSPSLLIDQPHHHDISRSLQPLQPKPYYTSIKDCVIRSYQSDGIRVFSRFDAYYYKRISC